MTDRLEVYKCTQCGIVVEVLHGGVGKMICCGELMSHVVENTVDAAKEKHIPVVEKTPNGYKVTVGSVLHPMEDKHFIEWIELIADGKAYRRFLNPSDAPAAEFCIEAQDVNVRAYCNLHGLWKA